MGLLLTIFVDLDDRIGIAGSHDTEPAVVVDYFLNVKKALDFLSPDVRTQVELYYEQPPEAPQAVHVPLPPVFMKMLSKVKHSRRSSELNPRTNPSMN